MNCARIVGSGCDMPGYFDVQSPWFVSFGIVARIRHGVPASPDVSFCGRHWLVSALFRRSMIDATAGRYPYSGSSFVALSWTSIGQIDETMPFEPSLYARVSSRIVG